MIILFIYSVFKCKWCLFQINYFLFADKDIIYGIYLIDMTIFFSHS